MGSAPLKKARKWWSDHGTAFLLGCLVGMEAAPLRGSVEMDMAIVKATGIVMVAVFAMWIAAWVLMVAWRRGYR